MKACDRRSFVRTTAKGAMLLTASGGLCETLSAETENAVRPCSPSDWQKHGVVLTGDGPRDHWLQNFLCASEPLDEQRWRLWYSINHRTVPAIFGIAEGVPGETMTRHEAVLSSGEPADAPLAIGNLPDGWRPVGPIHLRLLDGRHRLYFWIHSSPVVRLLVADSDDGRRYRVVDPLRPCLYHPHDRAVDGATASAAGLSRLAKKVAQRVDGEPAPDPMLVANDSTNIYQLSDGTFEMYSVGLMEVSPDDPRYIREDNAAGWIRVIDRFTSRDGLRFGDRQRVIVPDADDSVDQQFYYLAVTHTDRGRIGLLGNYRVREQVVDLEWCFSRDGVKWERPLRKPWLERGTPGEADSLTLYASHSLVPHAGRWHLFYTGVNYSHNFKRTSGQPRSVVMHASCRSPWQS
jgi:hypothetical protein